ncbi:MAG: hypothetical protein ABSG68_15905 [Thermoguttaceae bacterium]
MRLGRLRQFLFELWLRRLQHVRLELRLQHVRLRLCVALHHLLQRLRQLQPGRVQFVRIRRHDDERHDDNGSARRPARGAARNSASGGSAGKPSAVTVAVERCAAAGSTPGQIEPRSAIALVVEA